LKVLPKLGLGRLVCQEEVERLVEAGSFFIFGSNVQSSRSLTAGHAHLPERERTRVSA
jgi:hypothetical protein